MAHCFAACGPGMSFGVGKKVLFAHGPWQQQVKNKHNQQDEKTNGEVEGINPQRTLGSVTHVVLLMMMCTMPPPGKVRKTQQTDFRMQGKFVRICR
jgi:hypothetical protein